VATGVSPVAFGAATGETPVVTAFPEDHKRPQKYLAANEVANHTMDTMSGERFTNARVHEWLTPKWHAVVGAMHTTRVQLTGGPCGGSAAT